MSPQEKGAFTSYTNSIKKDKKEDEKAPKKYVKLYNMLNRQKSEPNELAIKREGFMHTDERLLRQKLLESLHVHHLGKSVESELQYLLDVIPWLYRHKHLAVLKWCIRTATRRAKKHELFSESLQILQWEKRLLAEDKKSKNLYEKYIKLVEKETEIRRRLDEEIDLYNLRFQLELLRIKDIALNKPESQQRYEQITQSPILQNHAVHLSLKAKVHYLHLKSLIALSKKSKTPEEKREKLDQATQYAKQLIEVFERNENKTFKNRHPILYKKELCLQAQIYYLSRKYDLLSSVFSKIENLNINDEDKFDSTTCMYGLLIANIYADKKIGEKYASKINTLINKRGDSIRYGRKMTLFYNTVMFYSLFGNWQKVNEWLSKMLEHNPTDDRSGLQCVARIWSLVKEYELESDDNSLQSVFKFIKDKQQYPETWRDIRKAFHRLYNAPNRKECEDIWKNFNHYLAQKIQEQENIKGQSDVGLQELQLWCQAKLQNTTMAAIIQQRDN